MIEIIRIIDEIERAVIFERMQYEGLTACSMSEHEKPTLEQWLEITNPKRAVFLCAQNDEGVVMGCATFTRFRGKCYEFDFTAFRGFFDQAVNMAKLGFKWMFEYTDCLSIVGFCPKANRHAWMIAEACGFEIMGVIGGMAYNAKRKEFKDVVLVKLNKLDFTQEGIVMGFSTPSTPAAPVYTAPEVEKQQVSKPVTEAATAARTTQKDKASKAAGLQGSILTSPVAVTNDAATAKTLLGQ